MPATQPRRLGEGARIRTAIARAVVAALWLGLVASAPSPTATPPSKSQPSWALVSSTTVPIAAGERSSLALKADGTVLSWGYNFYGSLGNGTASTTGCFCNPVPAQIPGLSGVVAVASGYNFNFAIKSDGTLWGFGLNQFGQLGDGTFNNTRPSPVQVPGLSGVVAATGSYGTAYAIESDGSLWAWGKNDAGQVGIGSQTLTGCSCVPTPTRVPTISGVTAVAASGENVMALTSDGTVWAWGDNAEGEVGNGTCSSATFDNVFSPFHLPSPTGITAIAATTGDSYALASDGTIWDWGGNGEGQLGRSGARCSSATTSPGQVPNFGGVVAIATTKTGGGFAFTATVSAILSDGTVWNWGDNNGCELGNGTDFNSPVPIQVPNVGSIIAIADGFEYSIAEKSDGTLVAWGDNTAGSLGDGTTGPYKTTCGDPNSPMAPIQPGVSGLALGSGGGAAPAFIYVALGDSYSSGEGNQPFENGGNYPAAVEQENTYTYPINGLAGNSCHRSLNDYAKLSAPNLIPGTTPLLVDRTCSGAQIVPPTDFPKGPIVPTTQTAGRTDDQVDQAIGRLNNDFGGKQPGDVKFVSVTMGGNDAHFGDLIKACLLPALVRQLFIKYEKANSKAPSELGFLLNHLLTCQGLDNLQFHTSDKIAALPGLETQAQTNLSATFPNARIIQMSYPVFVPPATSFPGDNCGGILRQDANYARSKGHDIDSAIRTTGAATAAQTGGRFQIVDLESAFGANPLCPTDPSKALINAISAPEIQAAINTLIAPGTQSRQLLDNFSNAYDDFRNCVIVFGLASVSLCKVQLALATAAAIALGAYFTQPSVGASIQQSFGTGPTPEIKTDTSQFKFHPNAAGWRVFACNLIAGFQGVSSSGCLPSLGGSLLYQFNGNNLTTTIPQVVVPGVPTPFLFNGFDPGSTVTITAFSTAVNVGSVTVDSSGVASGTLTVPLGLNPGVHRVTFEGTNNGSPRSIDVLIQINGRPTGGDDYGLYFSGFTQDSAVDINFGGLDLGTQTPDEDGGVFVEVPLPTAVLPATFNITATGVDTGKVVTQTVSPAPRSAGVWAGGGSSASLDVSGSGITITGWVHSDGALTVGDHGITMTGGAEYGTTATVAGTGNTVSPAPVQVAPGGSPVTINIADWRPGGVKATQLAGKYQAVPASACASGVWHPALADIQGSVVYVPCAVEISFRGTVAASIIAEGSITVDGDGVLFTGNAANFSLASAASGSDAIAVTGSGFSAVQAIWAAGDVTLAGHGQKLACGVYGSSITITAGGTEISACPTSP